MILKHLEPRLRVKEHELLSTLAALGGDPNHAGDATVETTAVLSATLEEVRDALQRLERADYGKCVECGQPIESSRLHAVPWTPYCLEDQEKQDLKVHPEGVSRWQSA